MLSDIEELVTQSSSAIPVNTMKELDELSKRPYLVSSDINEICYLCY